MALPPLSYNDTFGCKLTTSSIGTYYIVGAIAAAHATEYAGTITGLDNGTPVFSCNEFYDSAQLQVAKKLGARWMMPRHWPAGLLAERTGLWFWRRSGEPAVVKMLGVPRMS